MEICYFCGEVCNNSTKIPLCHKCDDGTKTLEKDKENTTN